MNKRNNRKKNHGGTRRFSYAKRLSSVRLRGFLCLFTVTLIMISCDKRLQIPSLLPPPLEPETQTVYTEPVLPDSGETVEPFYEEYVYPRRILVPYNKEYLSPGQETVITVLLENGDYLDDMFFEFAPEAGKNSISVESVNNVAVIKAVREGVQYLCVSHPKAQESVFIVYDVLPPAPPPPPEIDVSESPLIIRKGETRPLQLTLRNGKSNGKFTFQVVENAYALEARQQGDTLHITGIAPGAGKIRIQHPAALRDYDVMVIVD